MTYRTRLNDVESLNGSYEYHVVRHSINGVLWEVLYQTNSEFMATLNLALYRSEGTVVYTVYHLTVMADGSRLLEEIASA